MADRRHSAWAAVLLLASTFAPTADARALSPRGEETCPLVMLAETGMALPGGGTLDVDFGLPPIIDDGREVSFTAGVDGDPRNQGLFVVGSEGLREILRGCGGTVGDGEGGNCGDPTPIGGTFSGLSNGNYQARGNSRGDILFIADIANGSTERGLFLYRKASETLTKIAAFGDPSPRGGIIEAISGRYALDDEGRVAFLAFDENTDAFIDGYLAEWRAGAVRILASDGDPIPGGGELDFVVTSVFFPDDGTAVPGGPLPSYGENGDFAYRGLSTAVRGILLSKAGVWSW
ncbi:MAG: hypothetical protein AAGF23_26565, partial [Acidobacteriota bacterium]